MKMRMIKLNPNFFMKTIQGKAMVFASNLPDDVELLEVKYDLFAKQVFVIVRSPSFEDIGDTYPIPEFKVIYTKSAITKNKLESKPVANLKHELKPPTEKAPIQSNQDLKAVEEEFSPEQRELLSFKIDRDYVLVKPIQYLKNEWNEINDIVRSLGGKWVKGDFASYWAIPLHQS